MVGVGRGRELEKTRDDVRRVWFAGKNGRREEISGEKTHVVGVWARQRAEKPRNGLCIWDKERIMDVAVYM